MARGCIYVLYTKQNPFGVFIKGILRGVRCTKSLRVLFLHRRPPSWTTRVLYSRAVFIFNEPAYSLGILHKNSYTYEQKATATTYLYIKQLTVERDCMHLHTKQQAISDTITLFLLGASLHGFFKNSSSATNRWGEARRVH